MVATPEVDAPGIRSRILSPWRSRLGVLPERWLASLAVLVLGLVLFIAYLSQARTVAMNSDGAANALQAWDMLHGNVLLRGWSLSDVSWYTTELPQYMLVELARGLNGDVGHVAAAITYTLVVLLGALLAKGKAAGREGVVRALIGAGIMLAPSPGRGTRVLLTRPDHLGTQITLLLVWLVLDRARARWWVPVAVTAMLAWAQVADSLVLYEGVVPLVLVCGFRLYVRRSQLREHWYELELAVGAVLSVGIATAALLIIRNLGGFAMRTPHATFAPVSALVVHLRVTAETVLTLFGADFFGKGQGGLAIIAAALHLAGVVLAGWALARALRRFPGQDLVVQFITVALIVLLAAYLLGPKANSLKGAYEIGGVLPLGAVLAGRLLAGSLLAGRITRTRLLPALAVVLVCYAGFLFGNAAHRPAFSDNQQVAIWLEAHHLDYGLAWYWRANVVTANSGDQIQVRPLASARFRLILKHTQNVASWYNPRLHYANFVIAPGKVRGCLPRPRPFCPWPKTFGAPAQAYQVGDLVVMVWHKNLLDAHFKHTPPIPPPSIADGGPGREPSIAGS